MNILAAEPILLLLLATSFGLLLGLLLGRFSEDRVKQKIIESERGKQAEKDEKIAGEIYESLHDLHSGLVNTVRSYDSAVKTILDKLPTPNAKIKEMGLVGKANLALTLVEQVETTEVGEQKSEESKKLDKTEKKAKQQSALKHEIEITTEDYSSEVDGQEEDALGMDLKEPALRSVPRNDWTKPIA